MAIPANNERDGAIIVSDRQLDVVGLIDDSPDLLTIGKERDDPLPVGLPRLGDGRISAVSFPAEDFKIIPGQFCGGSLIDPL